MPAATSRQPFLGAETGFPLSTSIPAEWTYKYVPPAGRNVERGETHPEFGGWFVACDCIVPSAIGQSCGHVNVSSRGTRLPASEVRSGEADRQCPARRANS